MAKSIISDIRPLASDPNLRVVRVGNKTIATLRLSDIDVLGLKIGMAWTSKVEHLVLHTLASNKARQDAIKLLGRRQLSHAEVVERLIRKGHDDSIARSIAAEMAHNGWIDDAAMAAALREELISRKHAGLKLLQAKLRARKLDPHLGNDTDHAAGGRDHGFANALQLAKRRLSAMANNRHGTAQRRIAATLARKGYDDEIIERVLDILDLRHNPQDEF